MDEFVCSCCGDALHYDPAAYPVVEDVFVDPYAVDYADWGVTDVTWVDPYASDVYQDPGWIEPAYVEEFYVEPANGAQPYVEPAYVDPAVADSVYVEPAVAELYVEPAYVEPVAVATPAANVMTIGGFDLNAGIAVTEPTYAEPLAVAPAANVLTIGGFDPNTGITVVDPTSVEPAYVPAATNVATIGGFDLDGGITVVESGAVPQAANQLLIGGPPLPDFDVADTAWGKADWDAILSVNATMDPVTELTVGHRISMTALRVSDVASSNVMFNATNWGPSSGTSYNYEHRLQNNTSGTSY